MAIDYRQPTSQDPLSLQELSLYHAIMDYRASLGLAAIPLSGALTTTAGRHVADTRENIWAEGVELPAGANLHSWSDAYYYSDHRDPSVMWDAPQRVGTDYASAGYEISAAGFATTDAALEGWKGSSSHNAILTQTGIWAGIELNAIGIGVDTSPGAGIYAGRIFHVWFGETMDAGIPDIVGSGAADLVTGTLFADRILGSAGNDEVYGLDGDDELRGEGGADRLFGDAGNDVLFGGGAADVLSGGTGDDVLDGGSGNDRLRGGDGVDVMSGGDGDDVLFAGPGKDTMSGGAGADVFVFATLADSPPDERRAVITDFQPGIDRIDVSRIDANVATTADDAFVFVGRAALGPGQIRQGSAGISLDVNGDGVADMQIQLLGGPTLQAGDFIL
jgi:Ca2+-binding RTX toxin-like protein